MKYFLNVGFLIVLITILSGFYFKSSDPKTGDLLIGLSVMAGFFILMPAFIYHRWKDKNIKDYYLDRENIMKMRNYKREQETNKSVTS